MSAVATASAHQQQRPAELVAEPAEYQYHRLRAATDLFACGLSALSDDQWSRVEARAQQTFELETLVLASEEAHKVVVPQDQIDQAVAAVQGRYGDERQFHDELSQNGLDLDALCRALQRELRFDATMRAVGARHAPVTEADEHLFFELHADRFTQPETRAARHLLITINEEIAENQRAAARARIHALADQMAPGHLDEFESLARQHSECPTALEGGRLGTLSPGQLYPALDAALFRLAPGEISEVLESPLGFHLLYCEAIHPARQVPFHKARERIHQALTQRRERETQKAWIARLRASA